LAYGASTSYKQNDNVITFYSFEVRPELTEISLSSLT